MRIGAGHTVGAKDYTSDAERLGRLNSFDTHFPACYTRAIMRLPLSPHDTLVSAILRFVLELAALFAIGQAFGIGNFVISVAAIALFNAKGDKRFQGILVSGPIRLMIEVVIDLLGIYSTLFVLGPMWAGVFGAAWVVYLFLGRERLLWLARGAK